MRAASRDSQGRNLASREAGIFGLQPGEDVKASESPTVPVLAAGNLRAQDGSAQPLVFDSLHALGRAIREVQASPQSVPAHLRPLQRHLVRVARRV